MRFMRVVVIYNRRCRMAGDAPDESPLTTYFPSKTSSEILCFSPVSSRAYPSRFLLPRSPFTLCAWLPDRNPARPVPCPALQRHPGTLELRHSLQSAKLDRSTCYDMSMIPIPGAVGVWTPALLPGFDELGIFRVYPSSSSLLSARPSLSLGENTYSSSTCRLSRLMLLVPDAASIFSAI